MFPPQFRDLPPPALDLFDLDQEFSSERVRLAQVTNKCDDGDAKSLEYYVRECGDILGVTPRLARGKVSARDILEHVFRKVVQYKKLDQGL